MCWEVSLSKLVAISRKRPEKIIEGVLENIPQHPKSSSHTVGYLIHKLLYRMFLAKSCEFITKC
jgi:hypothetical protein